MKQAAILGVAAYVIGLLTINGYLLQFGVADFDIVRPRFALLGVIAMGIIATYPFAIWATVAEVEMFRGTRDWSIRRQIILFVLLLLVLPAALGIWANIKLSTVLGMFVIGAGLDGLIFVLYRGWFATRKRAVRDVVNMVVVIVLAVFLLACMIKLVFRDIITEVPEQFGGVKPRPVVVVVKKESAESLESLSDSDVRFGTYTTATQFDLLYEAQSFILVSTSRGTIWLDKDDIVALYIH